jgi:lipoyl(octanoyl) transferase
MPIKVQYQNLGLIDYKEAWDYQENLLQKVLEIKIAKQDSSQENNVISNYLLFCEHPHVYTLGKSGNEYNLLITKEFLERINATFYKINRGGDITYHGPGQLVGYPIIDLDQFKIGVKEYVYRLEEAVIRMLKDYNIIAHRKEKATGVWLGESEANERKICAIGVRVSRNVTMHGFALNILTDLAYFKYINPCGFKDKQITSIQKELAVPVDFGEIQERLKQHLSEVFGMEISG